MDTLKIMKQIKNIDGFFEVYHKTTFECYRKNESGHVEKVIVDILDAGPDAGYNRYLCEAKNERGKIATGNSGPTIESVLATVHWWDLN